jgi:hypothetical protein
VCHLGPWTPRFNELILNDNKPEGHTFGSEVEREYPAQEGIRYPVIYIVSRHYYRNFCGQFRFGTIEIVSTCAWARRSRAASVAMRIRKMPAPGTA